MLGPIATKEEAIEPGHRGVRDKWTNHAGRIVQLELLEKRGHFSGEFPTNFQ